MTHGKKSGRRNNPLSVKQLDVQGWHQRFQAQVRWTDQIRNYLFEKAALPKNAQILEVGSGTGAVLEKLSTARKWVGLDLAHDRLAFAKQRLSDGNFVTGDGHHLPFKNSGFDAIFCHYFLLWVHSPSKILSEMKRATRPGGAILALAEPDYQGRIDHPLALEPLGLAQNRSLRAQGADPAMGRKIRGLFQDTGLQDVESGILGAQWSQSHNPDETDVEHEMLRRDIEHIGKTNLYEPLLEEDKRTREINRRILFIPTFYALGTVPS